MPQPSAISESEIWKLVIAGSAQLSIAEKEVFEAIQIDPERWQLSPYGDQFGGFWAIGLIGKTVLWYNEIERGFNLSIYSEYGVISEYWCNQDELHEAMENLIAFIKTGFTVGQASPPK